MPKTAPSRYGAIAQAFHWLTAIVVLIAFIYGPGGSEERVYAVARDADRRLHETLGLVVLGLLVLRLVWKLIATPPAPLPMPSWMHLASRATHGMLYLLLIAVPVSAIVGAWLTGHPLTLLGGVDVAPRLSAAHGLGSTIAEVHGWLGDVILWLAGLHAAAGIYHHLVLRDGVLVSMLPARVAAPRPRGEG